MTGVWSVTGERQVRLQLDARAVIVPPKDSHDLMRHAGITVMCVEDGEIIEQTWIPVGHGTELRRRVPRRGMARSTAVGPRCRLGSVNLGPRGLVAQRVPGD